MTENLPQEVLDMVPEGSLLRDRRFRTFWSSHENVVIADGTHVVATTDSSAEAQFVARCHNDLLARALDFSDRKTER